MKRSLLLVCSLALFACEPRATTNAGDPKGAGPEPTSTASRGWETPSPRGDADVSSALGAFLKACPEPDAAACGEAHEALAAATDGALGRDVEGALGALTLAASRGGASARAAGSLAGALADNEAFAAAPSEALDPSARRLIEVWRASDPAESGAIAELTARVGLRSGRVEVLLEAAALAESDAARAALYRWLFVTGEEEALEVLIDVWDSRRESGVVRAGAARAPLELDEWPGELVPRLCAQARNQLEAGDPLLARWWVSMLWRCGGASRAYALEAADERLELRTFSAEFASALTAGPCAEEGAGLADDACAPARALLERALEDAHVESSVKVDALRALTRGWPDEGAAATIDRASRSADPALSAAAKAASRP